MKDEKYKTAKLGKFEKGSIKGQWKTLSINFLNMFFSTLNTYAVKPGLV